MNAALSMTPSYSPITTAEIPETRWARAWQRVLARDPSAEGQFVYAVTTTGIVCRPTCPSRRPSPQNVRFFASVEDAVVQGYRPCLRCQPTGRHADAEKARRMCAYLENHLDHSVTLLDLSSIAGLSTFATQRLFVRVMGVTPRRYQMGLRAAALRTELAKPRKATIADAVYASGYSAGSRLYEQAANTLGMKPARFRDGAEGEMIEACIVACALDLLLVARTPRGICHVALGDAAAPLEAELRRRFHKATIHISGERPASGSELHSACAHVVSLLDGQPSARALAHDLPLDLRATAFQQRVWQALQAIPRGETRSYRQVAENIGQPTAARAVARACASNTLALLIPCHRVIGGDGHLRGYRWGEQRKRKLLALERTNG